MNAGAWIALAIVLPVVVFVVWLILLDASVRVEPGTIGLMLRNGRATGRALQPGRHFVVPFRKVLIQTYPSRELSFVAGAAPEAAPVSENDYLDSAVALHLGDRTAAAVSYTIRCQLILSEVTLVHEQFGPDGIWMIIRDESRRCLIAAASHPEVTVGDAFGEQFLALERRLGDAVTTSMKQFGFDVTMFSLRSVDLGHTGEVVQSTLRARQELEREAARMEVRRSRLDNDIALAPLLAQLPDDLALRYRQLDAWQDILERWSGGVSIPAALTARLLDNTTAGEPMVESQPDEAHRTQDAGTL